MIYLGVFVLSKIHLFSYEIDLHGISVLDIILFSFFLIDLLFLTIDYELLVLYYLLTPHDLVSKRVDFHVFFLGYTLLKTNVCAVDMHTHLQTWSLHLRTLNYRLVNSSLEKHFLNLFLILLQPAVKCSVFSLKHWYFLF